MTSKSLTLSLLRTSPAKGEEINGFVIHCGVYPEPFEGQRKTL